MSTKPKKPNKIRNGTRFMYATRVGSVIRQYIILEGRPGSSHIQFDDILNLVEKMIYASIIKVRSKYKIPVYITDEDLLQEGRVTLFKCLDKFDVDNMQANFTSYFRRALYNNLKNYIIVATHDSRDVSLKSDSLPIVDGAADFEDRTYWPEELVQYFDPLSETLMDKLGYSKSVIATHRLILNKEPASVIANELNISEAEVIKVANSVIKAIKHKNRATKRPTLHVLKVVRGKP